MKIYEEITTEFELKNRYNPWGSADFNFNRIIESNTIEDFMYTLEDIYPEGIDIVTLNDILWFNDEFCYQFINDELLDKFELEKKKAYYD